MTSFFTTLNDIKDAAGFIKAIISTVLFIIYLLQGFSYKKLSGNYFGFIPIVGDIIGMYVAALNYNKKYAKRYLIWASLLLLLFPVFFYFIKAGLAISAFYLIFSGLEMISSWGNNALAGLTDTVTPHISGIIIVLIIIFIFLIIALFLNLRYRYKLLHSLTASISKSKHNGFKSFIFALFPVLFYIWILFKEIPAKEKETASH